MIHAKNYETVYICKSYAEKNCGLFFFRTRCRLLLLWLQHAITAVSPVTSSVTVPTLASHQLTAVPATTAVRPGTSLATVQTSRPMTASATTVEQLDTSPETVLRAGEAASLPHPTMIALPATSECIGFYRVMHCSAKCSLAVTSSICLSVMLVDCDHIGW